MTDLFTDTENIVTADLAAECNVTAAQTYDDAKTYVQAADVAFRASAAAFVAAHAGGAADLTIAQAVKARKADLPKALHADLYSSPTSVGYHRRTGMILALPGSLPEGTDARGVQTLVKGLKVADVDLIIGAAADQESAVAALEVAKAAQAKAKAAAAQADDDDADDDSAPAVKDAAHYLRAVQGSITKAVQADADGWTADAVDLAQSIIDSLAGRLADLAATQAATTHYATQNVA